MSANDVPEIKVPAIGAITISPTDLAKALKAVKETIEVREGIRGPSPHYDKLIRYRDLIEYLRTDKETVASISSNIRLFDLDDSNYLSLIWNEDDATNRIINFLVHGANRTLDLAENLKVLDGQNIELHASGGEKAQLAIDTQNAERTLNMSGDLTVEANSAIDQDLTTDAAPAFVELILTPSAAALSAVEGGIFYNSGDNSVYVCTEGA